MNQRKRKIQMMDPLQNFIEFDTGLKHRRITSSSQSIEQVTNSNSISKYACCLC